MGMFKTHSFHPKKVTLKIRELQFGFLIIHKNDLLVFGNTILQGGLCFVECAGLLQGYYFAQSAI